MIRNPRFDPAGVVPPLGQFIDGGLTTKIETAMVDLAAAAVADLTRS